MKPAAGRSAIRGPLASSFAGRSRCPTSRTAPSTLRAPLGASGAAAIRSAPATKPLFNAYRPESEDESKTCAATRFDEASKRAARTACAADAGARAPHRAGCRARSQRPNHHAGQTIGTRFRAQRSHTRAILGRTKIPPSLVSRRPCRPIGIDRSQSHLCNRPRRLYGDGEDGKPTLSSAKIPGSHASRRKIGSHVLEWAVCREIALEQIGQTLGWNSRPQAYAAAVERMKTALDELCKLWGIGS